MNKVVFVADIANDIDDVIAIQYLQLQGVLDCVVLDGKSEDVNRKDYLQKMGIIFKDSIPDGTNVVFCGGSLTKVNEYLKSNYLELLVANGGFASCNIVKDYDILEKFRNKKQVRTYNFNLDVNAAISVLNNNYKVENIILVSKNVCHSDLNVFGKLHTDKFLIDYNLPKDKRLHNLLMVKEGCKYMNNSKMICKYLPITPICNVNKVENMSLWGSISNENGFVKISVGFNNL